MKIDGTPAPAGIPLLVGDISTQTGADGDFSAEVPGNFTGTIRSDLPAIAITPVQIVGGELGIGSPVEIEAYRLLEPGTKQPCRALVGLTESVFWSYENLSSVPLEIPLSSNALNNFESPAGEAMPDTVFAPGLNNTFSRPLSQFTSGSAVSGIWNILGLRVEMPDPLPLCTDSGDYGGCEIIPPQYLKNIVMYTRRTVREYAEAAVRLKNVGVWKPDGNRLPFANHAAKVIASVLKIQRKVQPKGSTIYSCEGALPASCGKFRMPQKKLRQAYAKFFDLQLPPELYSINTDRKRRRKMKQFDKLLKKLPSTYVRCDSK